MDPHWNLGYPYGRPIPPNTNVPTNNTARPPEISHSHNLGNPVIAHSGIPTLGAFSGVHPQSFLNTHISPFKTSLPNSSSSSVMSSRPPLFDHPSVQEPSISRPQEVKSWSLANFVPPPSHPLGFPTLAHVGTRQSIYSSTNSPSDHSVIRPADPYQVLAQYKEIEANQHHDRYRQSSEELRYEEIAKQDHSRQAIMAEHVNREREKSIRSQPEYTSAHDQRQSHKYAETYPDIRHSKKDYMEMFNQSVQSVSPAQSPHLHDAHKQQPSVYLSSNTYQPPSTIQSSFQEAADRVVYSQPSSYQNNTFSGTTCKSTMASLIQQTCKEIDNLNRLGCADTMPKQALISKPVPMMQQEIQDVYNQPPVAIQLPTHTTYTPLNRATPFQSQQETVSVVPTVSVPVQAAADSTTVKKKRVRKKKPKKESQMPQEYQLTHYTSQQTHQVAPQTYEMVASVSNYALPKADTVMSHKLMPAHPLENYGFCSMGSGSVEAESVMSVGHQGTYNMSASETMAHYITGYDEMVNPQDVLAENIPIVVQPQYSSYQIDAEEYMMTTEDQLTDEKEFYYEDIVKPSETTPEVPDEEFAHLAPKQAPGGAVIKNLNSSTVVKTESKSESKPSAFQESFLNFLQGKKQETLSSVGNSLPAERPKLPKYVPEPPRPKPPPSPSPPPENKTDTSDICLSSDSEGDNNKPIHARNNTKIPSANNTKIVSLTSAVSSSGIKNATALNASLTKKGKSNAKARKVKMAEPSAEISEEEEVPVRRTLSSRKAKEKFQKEQEARRAKKNKKKKYKDDSDLSAEDFITLSSSDEGTKDSDDDPAWTPLEETAPASAKQAIHISSGSDSENSSRKNKKRIRFTKSTPPTKAIQFTKTRTATQESSAGLLRDGDRRSSQDSVLREPQASKDDLPKKGDYLLYREDIEDFDNFAIWKFDTGNLIQKYAPETDERGKLIHKATSTYSSWSLSTKDKYEKIQVDLVRSDKSVTYVRVREESRPKPQQDIESHPLCEPFDVYVQVLLSQALDPNFLQLIRDEKSEESETEYYLVPMTTVDSAIEQRVTALESKITWNTKFKNDVKKRPRLIITNLLNSKMKCQVSKSLEVCTKSVQLMGDFYDSQTLKVTENTSVTTQVFVSQSTADLLSAYHGLAHLKYALFKRCVAKIDIIKETNPALEYAVIVENCLQNRQWVLKLFEDLKNLLKSADDNLKDMEVEEVTVLDDD